MNPLWRMMPLVFVGTWLAGCADEQSRLQDIKTFCAATKPGESFESVTARSTHHDFAPGGFAQDASIRLGDTLPADQLTKTTGVLYEQQGTTRQSRPVCAIYYSDPLLGGDGRVVLAEFLDNWGHRH